MRYSLWKGFFSCICVYGIKQAMKVQLRANGVLAETAAVNRRNVQNLLFLHPPPPIYTHTHTNKCARACVYVCMPLRTLKIKCQLSENPRNLNFLQLSGLVQGWLYLYVFKNLCLHNYGGHRLSQNSVLSCLVQIIGFPSNFKRKNFQCPPLVSFAR